MDTKISYEKFKSEFLAHHCEMWFLYGEYVIGLVDAPKISDKAACGYMMKDPPKFRSIIRSFLYNIKNCKKDIICCEFFDTREQLLDNFRIDDKTIKELWNCLTALVEI